MWEIWGWAEGTCLWYFTWILKTLDILFQCQNIKDGIQGPQERDLLVLEYIVERKQKTRETWSGKKGFSIERWIKESMQEWKFHQFLCNKCSKYGHRESYLRGNDNKGNDDRNEN